MRKGWLWAGPVPRSQVKNAVLGHLPPMEPPVASQPVLGGGHPGGKDWVHCVGPRALVTTVMDDTGWDKGLSLSSCLLSSAKYSRAFGLTVIEMSRADLPPSLHRHRNAAFSFKKESQQE